jgi:hypothetical protein
MENQVIILHPPTDQYHYLLVLERFLNFSQHDASHAAYRPGAMPRSQLGGA